MVRGAFTGPYRFLALHSSWLALDLRSSFVACHCEATPPFLPVTGDQALLLPLELRLCSPQLLTLLRADGRIRKL